jgi:hypothetical protein
MLGRINATTNAMPGNGTGMACSSHVAMHCLQGLLQGLQSAFSIVDGVMHEHGHCSLRRYWIRAIIGTGD